MPVSDVSPVIEHIGNGVTTVFPYGYKILAATDMTVWLDDVLQTGGYTVSGVGVDSGGNVTFSVAPAANVVVRLQRNVSLARTTDYQAGGAFREEQVDADQDKQTMQIQQVNEAVGRAIKFLPGAPPASTFLPDPESLQLIGWDEAASALINYDPRDFATLAATSNWKYKTVIGDGTAMLVTLDDNPGVIANLDISVGGVTQTPITHYTVSGKDVQFVGAVPLGAVVLIRYGTALPQGYMDASAVYFIQTGAGAVTRDVQDKLRDSVHAKDYGVLANGVADDTAAMKNAAAACLAQKKPLTVQAGTVLLTDKVQVPYGLIGAGSGLTIFQGVNNGTKSGNLLEFTGPGVYRGFTVDGAVSADPAPWNSGNYDSFTGWNNIYLMADDINCVDIVSRNSAQGGFGAWQRNRCTFTNCRTQRTRGNFGDGFFAYLCNDFKYENCRAYDFTRIGFVFDGDGTTLVADRASYVNCYAEYGHDSSVLYGGGEYNSGFWSENHDNVEYRNCTTYDTTYTGFTVAAAAGGNRKAYLGTCHAKKTPIGYSFSGFAASPSYLNVVLDTCSYDADGVTAGDVFAIGGNTNATLTGCSAKLSGGGAQTRVVGLANRSKVRINGFVETWTSKPLTNLYDTAVGTASIGGFPGGGIVPTSIEVDDYQTVSASEPCVVKWIGSALSGALILRSGRYDIPLVNTDGVVVVEDATINTYGTTSRVSGGTPSICFRNSQIANNIFLVWTDALNQAVFDYCNFTRTIASPNITFYRLSGTTYKPSRLKILDSTFSSDLAALNYYIQQNAEPAVFNNTGQNIVVTGVVFHNTGGATSNFAIRQETTSGTASLAYVGSCWKSSTITNVATYLQTGAVINNL